MATLDSAVSQMLANGMPDPRNDKRALVFNKRVRYGKPKAKYWYILYEYRARNGQYYVTGAYGWWEAEQLIKFKVERDFKGMDEDERERLERSIRAKEEERARKEAHKHKMSAHRAQAQWDHASKEAPEGGHPYVVKKGIRAEGCRYIDDTLVIPMWGWEDGRPVVKGLQKISADGSKRFTGGMDKIGTMCGLGKVKDDDHIIGLTEGYATGGSVRMALDFSVPIFVAFDAGNLLAAAQNLRTLYPDKHIVIFADDDAYIGARINSLLAKTYGVEFGPAVPFYKTGQDAREFKGRAGPVVMVAQWKVDGDGVEGAAGALTFNGRTHGLGFTNAGMVKANAVAKAVENVSVVKPLFAERILSIDPAMPRFTDFNDLHAKEGLDAVKAQANAAILAGLAPASAKGAVKASEEGEGEKREPPKSKKNEKARAATPAAGKRRRGGDDDDDEDHWRLFRDFFRHRFTFVYGSDQAFDHDRSELMRLGNLNHAYTRPVVNWWLAWEARRTVYKEDVVFDPVGARDPDTTVNLFRGMDTVPNPKGKCDRLIELIYYLCGEHPEDTHTPMTDWVLRWAAYPLQHVGAKMKSAVVMHGDEGTGKNIFWGALRTIYGRYGGIISQNQLNSQFNTWLSAKLFLIANEVVTAQERNHQVGYLKTLVTEDEIYVEPKGVDARQEANHCNLVFLSNEVTPVKIGKGNRRDCIIWTPGPQSAETYKALGAELAAGGAEALYHYLLHLDLGDFNEHTKPPMNKAKQNLIEASMNSTQSYWQELHGGLLPMPYETCLMDDCYQGYLTWAARNGEKMPARKNVFSAHFTAMNGVKRSEPLRVMDPDIPEAKQAMRSHRQQRIVYFMGESCPEGMDFNKFLDTKVCEWRAALKEYRSRGRSSGRYEEGQDEPF
jgi:putative DNA primase/helicase